MDNNDQSNPRDASAQLTALFGRIDSLRPMVDEAFVAIDRDRQLPGQLSAALIDTGICRAFAPAAFGGLELDPVDGYRAIAALAALDGALGWNAMIPVAYSFLAGRLPADAAKAIYGAPGCAVAGQLGMGGQARVSETGYVASGRWKFGSAGSLATWFLAQCVVLEDGKPRQRHNPPAALAGSPDMRLVFTPRDNVEVFDNWQASGLRGSASHDYALSEVDVPDAFAFDLFSDRPTRTETLYQMPVLSVLNAAVASVPIGIARGAIEAFVEYARTKIALPDPKPLRESPIIQAQVARAEIAAQSAETVLYSAINDMWSTVQRGEAVTERQRANVSLGCINAGQSAVNAVDIIYRLAGSSAILQSQPFERRFRDVHAASTHRAMHEAALVPTGRVALGLDPGGMI